MVRPANRDPNCDLDRRRGHGCREMGRFGIIRRSVVDNGAGYAGQTLANGKSQEVRRESGFLSAAKGDPGGLPGAKKRGHDTPNETNEISAIGSRVHRRAKIPRSSGVGGMAGAAAESTCSGSKATPSLSYRVSDLAAPTHRQGATRIVIVVAAGTSCVGAPGRITPA